MSFKKSVLFSISSVRYICSICRSESGFESVSSIKLFNIKPKTNFTLSRLIKESLNVDLTKNCCVCTSETKHTESTILLHPPQYLVVTVNRFSFDNGKDFKEKTKLLVENEIKINEHVFILSAIIHHHGPTLRAGHYTTSIINHNILYTCNDSSVTSAMLVNVMESDSAYLVFYKLSI